MSTPSNPPWRYGVFLFPLAPLLSLVASYGTRVMLSSMNEALGDFLVGFVLGVLGQWLAVIFALVVTAAVVLDARALSGRDERDGRDGWTPNPPLFGAVGLVHVAGALFSMAYQLSVPAFGYYLYRRRQHVG